MRNSNVRNTSFLGSLKAKGIRLITNDPLPEIKTTSFNGDVLLFEVRAVRNK